MSTFSTEKMKLGPDDTDHAEIDPKCFERIQEAQADAPQFEADTEVFAVFANAVGHEARWFNGCDCHDRIWTLPITEFQKKKLMLEETGCEDCFWRGRRASKLARGHCKGMMVRVQNAKSVTLMLRVRRLSPEARNKTLANLATLKESWIEENSSKFAYWSDLPHFMAGVWPIDDQSQGIAKEVLVKHANTPANKIHRTQFRVLCEDGGTCFPQLFKMLVGTGRCHPDLEWELMQINTMPTHEQHVERLHAEIQGINTSKGRSTNLPTTCARLKQKEPGGWGRRGHQRFHSFVSSGFLPMQTPKLILGSELKWD